jgi:hypothetical protein
VSELQQSRWTNLARALFRTGRGDTGPVLPELEDALTPVVVLEQNGTEYGYLGDMMYASAALQTTAVAGQTSEFRLRNPVGSGKLVMVDGLHYSAAAAGTIIAGLSRRTTDLAAAGSSMALDSRYERGVTGLLATPIAIPSVGNNQPQPTNQGYLFPGNVPAGVLVSLAAVLVPGWALDVTHQGLNVVLTVTVRFRERDLDRAET